MISQNKTFKVDFTVVVGCETEREAQIICDMLIHNYSAGECHRIFERSRYEIKEVEVHPIDNPGGGS